MRIIKRIVLLAAVPILTFIFTPSPARADVPITGLTYRVVFQHDGKCMEVPWAYSTQVGVGLRQWTCKTPTPTNQKFWLSSIGNGYYWVRTNYGYCLTVSGASRDNGAPIQQWGCAPRAGNQKQQWFTLQPLANDSYALINVNSGKCLDLEGVYTYDGARVLQWSCHLSPDVKNQWVRFLKPI